MSSVFFYISFVVILVLVSLATTGIFIKPNSSDFITITPTGDSDFKKNCSASQTLCKTNDDCYQLCGGEIEMTCQTLSSGNGSIIPSTKACAPASSTPDGCDLKKGGVPTWKGWSDLGQQGWDCVCGFPEYASVTLNNVQCSGFNADICSGGTFQWDIDTGEPPSAKHCSCPENTVKMISRDGQKPICVPKEFAFADSSKGPNWYTNYYDFASL